MQLTIMVVLIIFFVILHTVINFRMQSIGGQERENVNKNKVIWQHAPSLQTHYWYTRKW